ncbi:MULTISPECIES: thiamine pyrophosphate-binding protein [unclassified Beijerinckia]|uniref:thiamine pyrophosphate-binding protein n=1 Tax=unclassified Beijerinckia TaxID=2638183 RepID=UPI0008947283|nr:MULTISPECIES: thiamine pyrophosphate-binding protein [unclassified Beijerinckia]MDH7795195.1 acetolactate synthase-1/2/3 large subunit [Beijerinckia sp. GAS462]SEB91550.1 Acetolactate synthase large subunit [Beijerinckia sp. 28-YEA-48]
MTATIEATARRNDTGREEPQGPLATKIGFGSDVVAATLRDLDLKYIALNPGASYRGLHDSIVNYLGNKNPEMLLCLHEEHAVHIAQGYAKATDKMMACAVHSNVGLMHATMAIFNAWCDRMPMVILGATGPLDAMRRRPWIDWIHTTRDQAAMIRQYVKFDDIPGSPGAAREALVRAKWIAETAPKGPVYINLDVNLQEDAMASDLPSMDVKRFSPKIAPGATPQEIGEIAELVAAARNILIIYGRFSRSEQGWADRVALAEKLNAKVLTDLKLGATFPTEHGLHVAAPSVGPNKAADAAINAADLILAFDAVDLGGMFKYACPAGAPAAKVVHVSMDHRIHNGWSMDHQGLPAVDLMVSADVDQVVPALLAAVEKKPAIGSPRPRSEPFELGEADTMPRQRDAALALRAALGDRPVTLASTTIAWNVAWWPLNHPLDYLGGAAGGGIGAGPGISVGAALALKDDKRLVVGVLGDGDFVMGCTAVWTAARYKLPLLIVVFDNSSFYNDEIHQERVAQARSRPPENMWIGQKMIEPALDLAKLAEGQGALGIGPVMTIGDLPAAFAKAIAHVEAGGVAVVDVSVVPGYE